MPARRAAALAIAVAALIGADQVSARRSEPSSLLASGGPVVVEKTGFGQESAGVGSLDSFGVVLRNRSATLDAVGVTVSVHVYGVKGVGEINGGDYAIKVIPAGAHFYVGAASGGLSGRITRVVATVRVRTTRMKQYVLPPVTKIRFDRKNRAVTVDITNPYSTSMNLDYASGYIVVFDRDGKVIGGASTEPLSDPIGGRMTLKPGARMQVGFPLSGLAISHVASFGISIDP